MADVAHLRVGCTNSISPGPEILYFPSVSNPTAGTTGRERTLVPWWGSDGFGDASSLAKKPDHVFGAHTIADRRLGTPVPDDVFELEPLSTLQGLVVWTVPALFIDSTGQIASGSRDNKI